MEKEIHSSQMQTLPNLDSWGAWPFSYVSVLSAAVKNTIASTKKDVIN